MPTTLTLYARRLLQIKLFSTITDFETKHIQLPLSSQLATAQCQAKKDNKLTPVGFRKAFDQSQGSETASV